ncbi:MAG: PAS domain S-box protein, partial [Desulfomonilaceae bacterium]
MSSNRLLWIGNSRVEAQTKIDAIHAALENIPVDFFHLSRDALRVLAEDPGERLIVIIESAVIDIDLPVLVTGIKQINPAIEMIILGNPIIEWENLILPRFYRPITLDQSCSTNVIISCVAKLQEMVEAKQDYEQLSRGIGDNIGMSRTSTEAVLSLLARQNCLGMISMRRDGFFTSYNNEAERLTGYSIEELAHIQVWAHTVLFDHETVQTLLDSISVFWARKTGRENMRLRIKRKDGSLMTLSMTAVVLLDNCGQARQIVMLFFDPLDIGSAKEYELLLDSSPCAIYSYLPEKGFQKISLAALAIINRAFSLNLSSSDILNRKIQDLPIPAKIGQSWQNFLDEVVLNPDIPQETLPPLGSVGRRILEHKFVGRVLAGSKEKFGVVAVIDSRDDLCFESKENQSGEGLAEETLSNIPRPFILLSAIRNQDAVIVDFKCQSVNRVAAKFINSYESFTPGMSLSQIFKDVDAESILFQTACEVTELGTSKDFELKMNLNRHRNQIMLIRFWMGKVRDGVALFFHDVTASRSEEAQLKHYRHIFSHMDEAIIVTDLDG